jgi:outer membrane receptor protein involved in Fe transport
MKICIVETVFITALNIAAAGQCIADPSSNDPTNVAALSQGGYGLWNAAAGYQNTGAPWKLQALVKNLTKKQYLITAAAPGSIPTGDAGPPRTVWITASRQW